MKHFISAIIFGLCLAATATLVACSNVQCGNGHNLPKEPPIEERTAGVALPPPDTSQNSTQDGGNQIQSK
jgi:hypothetical protein